MAQVGQVAEVAVGEVGAQLVIRSLPSYTSANMTKIVFAPGGEFYINSNSATIHDVVFWKLDISSSSSSSASASAGLIQFLSGSSVKNLWIRYCKLHDLWASDLAAGHPRAWRAASRPAIRPHTVPIVMPNPAR